VIPANAIDYEFINLLLTILNKAPVVLAVILHLFISLLCALIVARIFINGGQYPHDALKEQEDVVEGVDLEFLEECALDVALNLESLGETAIHVDLLEVFYHTYFFAIVDFIVIFQELGDYLLVYAWFRAATKACAFSGISRLSCSLSS